MNPRINLVGKIPNVVKMNTAKSRLEVAMERVSVRPSLKPVLSYMTRSVGVMVRLMAMDALLLRKEFPFSIEVRVK